MKIKKTKGKNKCFIKGKLKFEDYKHYLKATQLQNKINNQENHKEFIKNNKSILKSRQRLKSEIHNVFTEEVNKGVLSAVEDKRIQSIDPIETYAYGTNKDLVSGKENIKCKSTIKQYKND